MKIAYICWNYGTIRTYRGLERAHLVRLKSGEGLLRTYEELIELGIVKG